MQRNRGGKAIVSVCSVGLFMAACGSDEFISAEGELGTARLSITTVPAAVQCIRIEAASSVRSYVHEVSVVGGQSAIVDIGPLPLGELTFTGLAYPLACASVDAESQPTWFSAPTPATLVANVTANVVLTLTPGTDAEVSVDFDAPASCSLPEVNCFGSCVELDSDELNCGGCGTACGNGQVCQQSSCVNGFEAELNGGQPGLDACGDWWDFMNGLTGFYSSITFASTENDTSVVCSDPSRAQALCQALYAQSSTSLLCQGHWWQVRSCAGGIALSVSANFSGACDCSAENAVRPCDLGFNGGGVNYQTCNAPSQTLSVSCQ